MTNQISGAVITVKQTGDRWRVHCSPSAQKAWDVICWAICKGSNGAKEYEADWRGPGSFDDRLVVHIERITRRPR